MKRPQGRHLAGVMDLAQREALALLLGQLQRLPLSPRLLLPAHGASAGTRPQAV